MGKLKNYFKEISNLVTEMNSREKSNLINITIVLTLAMMSYPFTRSTTEAIFLQAYGAAASPIVWIYSVVGLFISIWTFSHFQKSIIIQKLFLASSIITAVIFVFGQYYSGLGIKWIAYLLFILKEVYIVLLIHTAYAFLNHAIDVKKAKLLYGPIGAVSSIGGIIGGLVTTKLTHHLSPELILVVGSFVILLTGIVFYFTDHSIRLVDKVNTETPLESVRDVKKYVVYIAVIVAISQFCMNLAQFKFNVLFAQIVPDKTLKTRYLGELYTYVNIMTLFVQFIVVPLCFRFVSEKYVQLSVPVIYLIGSVIGFGIAGDFMFPVAATFVLYKGLDYSLFVTAKELLYFPLRPAQKYGAKYITDMVVYRLAKGIISFILLVEIFKTNFSINSMLLGFLVLWIIILFPLFKYKKELQHD